MELKGDYIVPASRQAVWDALNSPIVLQKCIPGCEDIEQSSPTAFVATVQAKVGPVKARFKGNVDLKDLNPPESYRIEGQGNGGAAGFAKGGAKVDLEDRGPETHLSYVVEAQVGGKLAQIGQRFIDATAKKMADEFFQNLGEHFATEDVVAEPLPATPVDSNEGLPPLLWGGLLIVATLFLLGFLTTI